MDKFLSSEHVPREVGEALRHYVEREEAVEVSADRLADAGCRGYRDYKKAEGDQNLKWKRGGYRTLFDFLLVNSYAEFSRKSLFLNTKY